MKKSSITLYLKVLFISGGLSLVLFLGLLQIFSVKRTIAASPFQTFPWGTINVGDEIYGAPGPAPVRCHDALYQNARQNLDLQRANWIAEAVVTIPQGVALLSSIPGPSGSAVSQPLVLTHGDGFSMTVVPISLPATEGLNSGTSSTGVPSYSNVQIHGSPDGCTMQDNSPKASSNVAGDFYFNQLNNLSGLNGIHFTFSTPVQAFGAFFGDLETSLHGTSAFIRLLDANDELINDVEISSTIGLTGGIAAEESLCLESSVDGANVTAQGLQPGCGNGSTRWIGFVSDTPVAQALVVVGDNDPLPGGLGLTEKLSVMGITVVRELSAAELSVTKEAPDSVTVGESFNYTITLSNLSEHLAAGLVVTDVAPTGIAFNAVAGDGCQLANDIVTCSQATLSANSSSTIIIQATSSLTSPITNSALIAADNDTESANNVVSVTVVPEPAPPTNLCAEVSQGGGPALVINEILYNEAGSSGDEWVELYATTSIAAGEQFLLSDDETGGSRFERLIEAPVGGIPAGTYIVIHDDAGTDDLDPSDGIMTLWGAGLTNPSSTHLRNSSENVTLYQGSSAVAANAIDYVRHGNATDDNTNDPPPATILWGGFAPGGASNEQSIARTENGVDGSSGDDWALAGDEGTLAPATPGAHNLGLTACNVAVTKSGPSTALVGNDFDYTIIVTNTSSVTMTEVTITDTAPTGVVFLDVFGPSCNLTNDEIRCAIGTLAPKTSQIISISAYPTTDGMITNTVLLQADEDSDSTDNLASHATTVETTATIGDYVYLDENGNGIQEPNETTPINEVTLTLTGGDSSTATVSIDGLYSFDNLPPGTYTVTVEIPSGFERTGPESYVIGLGSGELITNADFGLRYAPVDVNVAKVGPLNVPIGDTLSYTLTIVNPSPTTTALDVTLSDFSPAGIPITDVRDPRCAHTGHGLVCHLGNIGPLESVHISATAKAAEGGSWTNSVEITGTNESGGANNLATATTEVLEPQLRLDKTIVGPRNGPISVGETVTFALRIENEGDVSMAGLHLKDSFDAEILEYQTASIVPDNISANTLTWVGTTGGAESLAEQLPLAPGDVFTITVEFEVINPTVR
ncbi:MAG: SdrD B-like domain-containing protein [Chloroflexota bacterium]